MLSVGAAGFPLSGVRVVELSSFVASPLCGMTLAQLGADVVRVDPIGGAADYHRLPVTDDGESIFWAGLNKGKRSLAVDLRSPAGQDVVRRLVADAGILVTNAGRGWSGYDALVADRPDLIHLLVLGLADGSPAVDYTVNARIGLPLVTGPVEHGAPVNSQLPAWDIMCGLYAALAVTAAVRERERSGRGARIELPLEDVALALSGTLGFLSEAQLTGRVRPRVGNYVFGTYGTVFTSADGVDFMVVALTNRHFRDLAAVTGRTEAVTALGAALDVDFTDEGVRFRHRDVLTGLFADWFRGRSAAEVEAAMGASSVLCERYRTYAELATHPIVTENPLFTPLDQPRLGEYLAPGSPLVFDGVRSPATPAPTLGDDSAALLAERLGMSADEIAALAAAGAVAGPGLFIETAAADQPRRDVTGGVS